MTRTIFLIILSLAVTSVAAQNKQKQIEAQQRLIELAKEVWKCFPTECMITSDGDMDKFMFCTQQPRHLFRPTLIDSLNVAFAEAIPTTTYASAMKYNRLDNSKDSISYTMTWDKLLSKNHTKEYVAGNHDLPSRLYSNHASEAIYDNMNDSIFLWIVLPHRKSRQIRYDISGLDSMLEDVKKTYPTTHQKVKFPKDPTLKGDKYVISCNADSVFDVLSQYVLRDYWYEDRPMMAIDYYTKNAHSRNHSGQEMQLLLYDSEHICNDRYIEFVVCADKLLLLDLKNMHDYSNWYQYLYPNTEHYPAFTPIDWIQKLEPELYRLDEERYQQRIKVSVKKHESIKQ